MLHVLQICLIINDKWIWVMRPLRACGDTSSVTSDLAWATCCRWGWGQCLATVPALVILGCLPWLSAASQKSRFSLFQTWLGSFLFQAQWTTECEGMLRTRERSSEASSNELVGTQFFLNGLNLTWECFGVGNPWALSQLSLSPQLFNRLLGRCLASLNYDLTEKWA